MRCIVLVYVLLIIACIGTSGRKFLEFHVCHKKELAWIQQETTYSRLQLILTRIPTPSAHRLYNELDDEKEAAKARSAQLGEQRSRIINQLFFSFTVTLVLCPLLFMFALACKKAREIERVGKAATGIIMGMFIALLCLPDSWFPRLL